ncbi:MAG: sucrose-6-phosphate hydrolase [Clostridium perfringens]|nr:sucrose-6-phosphate hydrolase [Clostridium perfringens]
MKFRDILDINKDSKEFYKKEKNHESFRNNYHFQPPFGLINDPNGLSYFNGEYNIFFQWNPLTCEHKFKHWGLIKTKDFVNYTIPKVVLAPDDYYDKNGCYSGSAIERNGVLELLYTGNVKDENDNRLSYQCIATMDKEGNIKKLGPVLDDIPKGYTPHFRDPKVYFKEGKYYFVIGAQTDNLKGRVLLYSSLDMRKWNLEGEIKTSLEEFGYMWECPSVAKLQDKDILVFSPQGLEKEEFKYQNIYQSGYIIGDLNYNTLEFNHGEFHELDMGFDFYAPQVFKDNKERTLMIGWMGVPEDDEDKHVSLKENWIHSLTIPRELTLREDRIYQNPVEEMKLLREKTFFCKENFSEESLEFSDINKNSYEFILELENTKDLEFKIEMFKGNKEHFDLYFKEGICLISRENIIDGPKGIRKLKLNEGKNLKLHIFVDKSAVEIYINDGEYVASSRVFAKENSLGLSLKGLNKQINIDKLQIWTLKGVNYNE